MNGKPPEFYKGLPPEYWPVFAKGQWALIGVGEGIYLGKGFGGRVITVGTTATRIIEASKTRAYIISNLAKGAGEVPTTYGLVTSQAAIVAAGNTQVTPLGVANYLNMQLFLNITAIAGGTTWSFFNQVQNPVTLNWADSQVLIGTVTPAVVATWTGSEFYANIGTFGVGTQYALRWTLDVGAGAISFSLAYILKYGTIGAAAGLEQTVYIGSNSEVSLSSNYYVLPESVGKVFQVAEGVEVWAIAPAATNVNVLEV